MRGGGFRASRCVLFADFDAHIEESLEQCQPNATLGQQFFTSSCDWMRLVFFDSTFSLRGALALARRQARCPQENFPGK